MNKGIFLIIILVYIPSIVSAEVFIDFDYPTDVRTQSGYESFIPAVYTPQRGYGWVGGVPSALMVSDENLYIDPNTNITTFDYNNQLSLFRDCHTSGSVSEFVVDLDPGLYHVSFSVTHLEELNLWSYSTPVSLEDFRYDGRNFIMAQNGYVPTQRDRRFDVFVEVLDGQLTINFEGRSLLCGLDITLVSRPEITSIVGDFIHGQTMSVSGNLFGTKFPVEPLIWDDFENGVAGEGITLHSDWTAYRASTPPLYSPIAYAGILSMSNEDIGEFATAYKYFNYTDTVYTNYKYYYFWTNDSQPGGVRKLSRIGSANAYNSNGVYNGVGDTGYSQWFMHTNTGEKGVQISVDGPEKDSWHTIEQFKQLSTYNEFDGKFSLAMDGVLRTNDFNILTRGGQCVPRDCFQSCDSSCTQNCAQGDTICQDQCEVTCNTQCKEPCDFQQNSYLMGLMWANTHQVNRYMDNVYVDNTIARIMVCDVDNWQLKESLGAHCEIQIPKNVWVNQQIEFEVNTGNFTNEEISTGLYLFVVDENGVASDGFPLSLSSRPSIISCDGSFAHGQNLTLKGFGFGLKFPVEPFRYFNFDDDAVGGDLISQDEGGFYVGTDPNRVPHFSDALPRYPGDIGLLQIFGVLDQNQGVALYQEDLDEVYMTGWTYRDDYDGTAGLSDNQKLWGNFGHALPEAFYGNPEQRFDSHWAIGEVYGLEKKDNDLYATECSNPCTCQNLSIITHHQTSYEGSTRFFNEWFRAERYSYAGTPNGSDGLAWVAVNGQQLVNISGTFYTCDYGNEPAYNYWILGHFVRNNGGAKINVYWSEIYLDKTQARIELCNVSDFLIVEKHCEIQIPHTTWIDSEIAFTVNLGSFTQVDSNDDLYLFVVDGNGGVSSGFPLNQIVAPVTPGDLNGDGFVNLGDFFSAHSLSELLLVGRNLL